MQHAARRLVENRLVQRPVAYGSDDRGIADPEVGRHFKIKTAAQRGDPIMDSSPVGDHQALETPLVAQHLGEQPVMLRGVAAIDLVVGTHDRPGLRELHDSFERREIDLTQRPLIDFRADAKSIVLLVVGRIVLQRGTHPLTLGAAHHGSREFAGEPRILGDVLKVPPAQR